MPTTANGVNPAARSAAIAEATAETGSRNAASDRSTRTSPSPITFRSRRIEPWAWSLRYTTPPPPRDSRAATSAVSDAIDPPLTSKPSVPAGIPHHERSQSTTASSTVDGPEDATQDVPSRLNPDDTASARNDTEFDGEEIRANQRGWMFVAVHGTTSSSSRSNAALASPGASGGGPPSASASSAGSPTATVGCVSRDDQCSTIRSITR